MSDMKTKVPALTAKHLAKMENMLALAERCPHIKTLTILCREAKCSPCHYVARINYWSDHPLAAAIKAKVAENKGLVTGKVLAGRVVLLKRMLNHCKKDVSIKTLDGLCSHYGFNARAFRHFIIKDKTTLGGLWKEISECLSSNRFYVDAAAISFLVAASMDPRSSTLGKMLTLATNRDDRPPLLRPLTLYHNFWDRLGGCPESIIIKNNILYNRAKKGLSAVKIRTLPEMCKVFMDMAKTAREDECQLYVRGLCEAHGLSTRTYHKTFSRSPSLLKYKHNIKRALEKNKERKRRIIGEKLLMLAKQNTFMTSVKYVARAAGVNRYKLGIMPDDIKVELNKVVEGNLALMARADNKDV